MKARLRRDSRRQWPESGSVCKILKGPRNWPAPLSFYTSSRAARPGGRDFHSV